MGVCGAVPEAWRRYFQARTGLWTRARGAVVVVHDPCGCRQEHHGLRAALRRARDGLYAAAIRDCRAADRARPSELKRRDEMPKYVIAYLGGKQMPKPAGPGPAHGQMESL